MRWRRLERVLCQRAADGVVGLGGSWTFGVLFGAAMTAWIRRHAVLLASRVATFDPGPYIRLNLLLSVLAAIRAPVIPMPQN